MNSTPSVSASPWFRRWGWVYRPVHPAGFAVLLVAAAFLANVFYHIDQHAHSASDTLYGFYVYAAPTFLGLLWIASCTSDVRGGVQ